MRELRVTSGRNVCGKRLLFLLAMALVVSLLAACAGLETKNERGKKTDNRPLQLVSGSAPIYPPALKERGIEGLVTVRYDVTPEGRVKNLLVVRSSPPGLFDDAALQAVSSWVFRPQIRAGRAEGVFGITSHLTFRAPGRP